MEDFFSEHGYDANIVKVYDDVIDSIKNKLGAQVTVMSEPLQDIVRRHLSLKVTITRKGERPFNLFVPTGSKYYPIECPIKGYFIVRGQSYVFVSMDQAVFSFPIIKGSKKRYAVYGYTYEGITRYLKLQLDETEMFYVMFHKKRLPLYEFFCQMCYVYGKETDQIFQNYKTACNKCSAHLKSKSLINDYAEKVTIKNDIIERDSDWDYIKTYFSYDEIVNVCAYMSTKIVSYSLDDIFDDVDDESFKTVQTAAATLLNMFYRCFKDGKENNDALCKIEEKMKNMFLRGNVANFVGSMKQGVCQELESNTVINALSHIRRIKVYMSEDQAPYRVREYNRNHRNYTCMFETSDSKAAGLNKVLAVSCLITRESNNFKHHKNIKFSNSGMPVFMNGRMIGFISHPKNFTEMATKSKSPTDTWSIYIKNSTVCINTSSGRLTRPVLYHGNVMFMDIGEYITYHKTIQEIYKNAMLGLSASLTTFPNMSPGPRNNYQCSMNKQAISWCPLKLDSTNHEEKILVSPDAPYVLTDGAKDYLSRFLDFRHTNVVVAVMSDLYNNEDAIILNEGAVKRGTFANIKVINERFYLKDISNTTHTDASQVKVKARVSERILVRTKFDTTSRSILYTMGGYVKDNGEEHVYDIHGTIQPWNILEKGSVYQTGIDRTRISSLMDYKYNQLHPSVTFAKKQNIKADHNVLDEVYVEVSSARFRLPEIGDKFATDISQKGVCAKIRKESEMIQLPDGTIPHIIINPHGFPSRMTVGTLLNMAIGKYMCTQDKYDDVFVKHFHEPIKYSIQRPVNASVFRDISDLIDLIKSHDKGVKVYNPQIGIWTEKELHFGILPYIALKQQIDEKAAARLTGPVSELTGQPISGRKKGGGFALGEMEVNALIAYNASGILRERMFESVDKVRVRYCRECSFINLVGNECNKCGSKCMHTEIRMSFVAFRNLMMCMGVGMKVSGT